jgi:hypothetical protein
LQAHGFRFYFTPLTAVLFTFPSRYWFTIGRQLVFSLTPWSARIHTEFHVFRITQELPRAFSDFDHGGFTLSAGAFHLLDLSSKVPQRGPTTPEASFRFGLLRFRSPLLTQSILFLFLRLLRCFTSPGIACFFLPSPIKGLRKKTMEHYLHQVTPFGNLRIKAHVPLPEAYRSLSRPSSPVGTKASTVCPLKLDSLFEISHADLLSIRKRFPRFADLSIHLQPVFRPAILP